MDKNKKENPEVEKTACTEEEVQQQPAAESQEAANADTPEAAESTEAPDEPAANPAPEADPLAEQLAAMQEKYLRTYAEYENYRKRTSAQMVDLQLNGHKDMAKAILPVVDDMERALAALAEDDKSREGVKLIYDKLIAILLQKGVKQMKTIGEAFDSELHEAVTQIPAPAPAQKNHIIDEVLKGYYLNDKILRHPKVVVAV